MIMELSKEHLIKLISELDINTEYDYVKVGEIQEKINSLNEALEADMMEWESLTEELDNINKIL